MTDEASKFVASEEHIRTLVAVGIQSLMQNAIGKMITELMREDKIRELGATDLVNCISKIMRLLPGEISRPIAEELSKKLHSVDLGELQIEPVPNNTTDNKEENK